MVAWPDLLFAVNLLFYFVSNSGKAYWKAMKYILAYIKGTIDYRITYYHKSSLQPISFVNSDYANDHNTR